MEINKVKNICTNLKKFDYLAKENDFISVTEWKNDEGWTIDINSQLINLTRGELEAINYLVKYLEYDN